MSKPAGDRHTMIEDVLAILTGSLVVSLGVALYAHAMLALGGNSGLALLLQYSTGWSFAVIFSLINLPFYLLAIWRMGWLFTLRTFAAVSLVSVFVRLTPQWLEFGRLAPLYAAIAGGCLIGIGMLVLFRHRTGLGGINILAIWLQERFGWRAGYVQLGIDLVILAIAFFILPADKIALSVLGAVVINMILALNHRPGRYAGYS
ncbi:MAG: YitT family protein [Rhizobiaceae bacterium]|nr:YitT family protein [Rhizobiaceae bacterium]